MRQKTALPRTERVTNSHKLGYRIAVRSFCWKCCVSCIGKGEITDQFYVDGTQLPVVSLCRDFGVTVGKDLPASEHITDIVVHTDVLT